MAYQTINETQFREYQEAWRSIVPKDATPLPAKYFKTNGTWLSGYEIDMEIQAQLDRNTAVERVVFSFVVQDDTVKIAMHGAGATTNEPLTPYYLLGTGIEKPLVVKAPAASVQPTDRATLANPKRTGSQRLHHARRGAGMDSVMAAKPPRYAARCFPFSGIRPTHHGRRKTKKLSF